MQFKPIGAVITLDSASGNHINSAKSVYVSATADATLTLKDSAETKRNSYWQSTDAREQFHHH